MTSTTMFDRIKYEVLLRMWEWWHMWLPKMYDDRRASQLRRIYNRACKDLNAVIPEYSRNDEICPMFIPHFDDRWGWRRARMEDRPAHQLCCNGNHGGWRTRVCDWLETGWRGTKHYNKEG